MPATKGTKILVTKTIRNRVAYYAKSGKEGTTKISLSVGDVLKTATDELGGNIFAETKSDDGDRVIVGLAEGEWEIAET